MANLVFIPAVSAVTTSLPELADIPQETRDEVEQAYAALKANPGGRFRVEFKSEEELRVYERLVKGYCLNRPDGEIRFRRSPSKGLAKNVMDFRITDVQTENEAATAAVRAATVKAGGSDGTPTPATVAKKAAGRPRKAA